MCQIYIGNTLPLVDDENAEQPQLRNVVSFASSTRTFSILQYSRQVFGGGEYYWSLPMQFLRNKVACV